MNPLFSILIQVLLSHLLIFQQMETNLKKNLKNCCCHYFQIKFFIVQNGNLT